MKYLILPLVLLITTSQALAGDLEKLHWMSGHWVSADGAAEEVWLSPKDGSMTGSFRWVFPNGRHVLEYLIIQENEKGVTFRFKHFDTEFNAWEKQAPNTYRLETITGNSVSFIRTSRNENAPLKLSYALKGNKLVFHGEGDEGEEPLILEFEKK